MNKAPQTIPGLDTLPSKIPRGIDWIEEMAGALTDPIIVFPNTGWENDLPQPLRDRLPMERLVYLHLCMSGKADIQEALDIEALLYLYPASLAAPMGEYWTRIYLYLGTKVMRGLPEDVKEKNLSEYEMGMLRDFKYWLRASKVKARKERRKEATTTEKPAATIVTEKYEQAKLF